MEDIKEKKLKLRRDAKSLVTGLPESELAQKQALIEEQLFEFANFKEAETVFFYISREDQTGSKAITQHCLEMGKEVVLPFFEREKEENIELFKINRIDTDLCPGPEGFDEPDPQRCKPVSFDSVDIAVISGIAFDEKGGRLGSGSGRWDRLLPLLPNTARKVAIAFEDQILPAIPMESHDKYVDIIITDKRIIYKI